MTYTKQFPGKGLGLVADKEYHTGDVILEESVSLYCSRSVMSDDYPSPDASQTRQIYQQYRRLSTLDRFRVSRLFCLGKKSVVNIFSTNSFAISNHCCGLFIKISRINHSCDPNACYNHNGRLEKQVTAIRSIAKGEEITISYTDKFSETKGSRPKNLDLKL